MVDTRVDVAKSTGERALRGSNGQVFDLDAPTGGRRRARLPEIALGVLLMAGCALGALWWQLARAPATSILVASQDIERGEVIGDHNLTVAKIESEEPLVFLGEEAASSVTGGVALTDIAENTPLTNSLIGETSTLGPDEAIVGLYLGAGQSPGIDLPVGTSIDIILTPEGGQFEPDPDAIIASGVRVVEYVPGAAFGQMLISVAVSKEEAVLVTRAAAVGRVHVVEAAGRGDS